MWFPLHTLRGLSLNAKTTIVRKYLAASAVPCANPTDQQVVVPLTWITGSEEIDELGLKQMKMPSSLWLDY